mmetsp:Transcript_66010/g.123092  ORF Transcript_66010/g.123092 Transcript_66010/m.123092 type:complete len:235 (+) Transcript_66010:42-746(+)
MMLLRLVIAAICLIHSTEGSKFTACLKHCQAKLTEKGRGKSRHQDEAEKCREKCLPHKEKWDAEHGECYDDCMEGKVADSHNKRECSRECHRRAVNDHANERFQHKFHRNMHDQERKKQGLPTLKEERRMEKFKKHRERIEEELGEWDPESRTRLRECVAGCREGKADWEKEVRDCNRECQKTHMGDMEHRIDRMKDHFQALHESGELEDDDDDVWGVLKHHHSGPGINGGLEL